MLPGGVRLFFRLGLAATLLAGSAGAALAEGIPADLAAAAARLAGDVSDMARTSSVARAKREKQVVEAVRMAVSAAVGRTWEPAEVLAVARPLVAAAAAAAPEFAEAISNAIAFAPAMPRGAAFRDGIRAAAYQAAATAPAGGAVAASGRDPGQPPGRASSAVPDDLYGRNTALTFTVATSVRHDDNVYLNNTGEVGDTIMTVTPGIDLRFGRQSLVHGSIGAKVSLAQYADDSAPRSTLGAGQADLAYERGNVAVSATAAFQQLQQNTGEAAALNAKAISRRDVLNLATNVQAKITDRTSVQTGANLSQTKYKSAGLVGSDDLSLPIRVYVETSPKLNVSAGVTYTSVKPQNGGPSARDFYYNTGISGSLTPKLTAQLSLGYRTREVESRPRDGLWGFDGVLSYAATTKTRLGLVLSRNFSTGALGETSTSSNYTLQLASDPSPRWRFAGALTHRDVDYGDAVFNPRAPLRLTARQDRYWEGSLQFTYSITGWLSASLDTTLRSNQSTLAGAEFSNRIVGLTFAFRF
jgi:hypothetical protein